MIMYISLEFMLSIFLYNVQCILTWVSAGTPSFLLPPLLCFIYLRAVTSLLYTSQVNSHIQFSCITYDASLHVFQQGPRLTLTPMRVFQVRMSWDSDIALLEGEEIVVEVLEKFPVTTSISHNFVRTCTLSHSLFIYSSILLFQQRPFKGQNKKIYIYGKKKECPLLAPLISLSVQCVKCCGWCQNTDHPIQTFFLWWIVVIREDWDALRENYI